MQPYLTLASLLCSLTLAAGCAKDDVGKRCEPKPEDPLPAEPVGGEHPTNEIVALQRNGSCESFQCLSYRGYPSICTRSCVYDAKTRKGECTTNADCPQPLHCFDGQCQDDDCPDGFECRAVQSVGPLAGQLFCIQKEGCASDFDCESVGHVDCKKLACFDSNLLDETKTSKAGTSPIDGSGTLTCVARSEVEFCVCTGGAGDSCVHPSCDPLDNSTVNGASVGTNAWPEDAVELRDVCVRRL